VSLLVVRVRVRLKRPGKTVELRVLANGGAESPKPCVVVDPSLVEALEIQPLHGELYSVEEASSVTKAYLIPDAVTLELLDESGSALSSVKADLVVQEGLHEPLITDITIDSLGIQVLSFSRGLWRHLNDPPQMVRRSAET